MEISELLHGSTGRVISSICIMVILVLMCMITIKLYMSRRKKAYVSLALSLVFVIAQYTTVLVLEMAHNYTPATDFVVQLLKVLAFIWVNLGIFQLYNPTSNRVNFLVLLLHVIAAGLTITHIYIADLPGLSEQLATVLSSRLWLECFLLLLIVFAFLFLRPYIGQHGLYVLSLGLFLLAHGCHMIDAYMLEGQNSILQIIENYLPVFYYGNLFFIVFNRVVELMQAVYESSILDGLTGVYNRNYIMRYTQGLIRTNQASVIFCDIDNFKRLNDTQGHQKGDEVLKAVAAIMADTVGDKGKVGRYGGEEMVAVLHDTSKDVEKTALAIRRRVESDTPVTVSVGFSKVQPGVTVQELMKQADEAMYVSKKTGKNKITPYTDRVPQMLASIGGR